MSQSINHNLDAETFMSQWWSGYSAPLSLGTEEEIEKSYLDPESFWKDVLFPRQEQLLPPTRSVYGEAYNFYHDCIIRHVKSKNVALSFVQENGTVEDWTYAKLHECVNFHVDKWSYYSPEAGQLIAIVGEAGPSFVISLLTALRLGLKICYFPTHSSFLGKQEIRKFLSEIKPQFIVAEENFFAIEGLAQLPVNENGLDEEEYAPLSFAYPANKDVQIALSLQSQEALAFVSLSAHASYLNALRDALFTLDLPQHPYWVAPLACPICTEPCSTLMTLLCGTTRVHVSDEIIRQNPQILREARVNVIGISTALQELWSRSLGSVPTRYLKCGYRSPLNINYQSWRTFLQLNKLEKVPIFNVWMDNAMGGISLFSRPSFEPFNLFLKPTLGRSWSLTPLDGNGKEALAGFGLFKIDSKVSNFTVTQIEHTLMMTGFVHPCREGATFPLIVLEKLVNSLPFVEVSMMHHIPKSGTMFSRHFVLLVFVRLDIELAEKDNWSAEISKTIIDELGRGFLPDQIEYFPLLPKLDLHGIDRGWCANQYDSGLLVRKREITLFQVLNRLKKLAISCENL